MSHLTLLRQAFGSLAQGCQRSREHRRRLEEFRAAREAKIARDEAPSNFRSCNDYLQSEWWQRLRGHVLQYLSHKCEFCTLRATQVHHVRYPRIRDLGSESIMSLYAVCSQCHDVAHGFEISNNDVTCAFCESKASATLSVAIKRDSRSTQRVCRCSDSLANGFRGQANRWTRQYYDEWVERWRQTIPPHKRT